MSNRNESNNTMKWLSLARHYAKSDDVYLDISRHNQVPKTDGKTIFLPALPKELKSEHYYNLLWWLIHETSHIRFTDFEVVGDYKNSKYPPELIHNTLNAIEDSRIDNKRVRGEPGLLSIQKTHFINIDPEMMINNAPIQRLLTLLPLVHSMYLDSGITAAGRVHEQLIDRIEEMEPNLKPKVMNALSSIRDEMNKICNNDSKTIDALELAEKYLDELDYFNHKPEEPEETEDSSNDENEEDGTDESSDETDQNNNSQDSNSESGGEENSTETETKGKPEDEDSNVENATPTEQQQGKPANAENGRVDYDPKLENESEHPMVEAIEKLVEEISSDKDYENASKFDFDYFDLSEKDAPEDLEALSKITGESRRDARKLEEHLEDLLDEMTKTKKSFSDGGRFGNKSISRLIQNRDDCFIKSSRTEKPARHLSILIDTSYSMNSHINEAIKAAALVMPALDIIDASYSVITFGDGSYNVKKNDESTRKGLERLGGLAQCVEGGTPMGEAVELAIDSMPSNAESMDILVITDGVPNNDIKMVRACEDALGFDINTHLLSVGENPQWASDTCINYEYVRNFNDLSAHLCALMERILIAE